MHFDQILTVHAMDMVAQQLGLPEIDQAIISSSLKPSKRRSADLFLLMAHPDWDKWIKNMPAVAEMIPLVCQKLSHKSSGHEVHISSCRPAANPSNSIAISFDRSKTVPLILSLHQNRAGGDTNQPPISDAVTKSGTRGAKVTLITVKTPERGWTSRRIDLVAAAIRRLIGLTAGHEPDLHELVTGTECTVRSEAAAEYDAIRKKLTDGVNEDVAGVEIDASSLLNPDLRSCSFILQPESAVLTAVLTLRRLIPEDDDVQLVLLVHYSQVMVYKRAAAVICLTSAHAPNIRIIPVDPVKCDQDPDEFTDWLKNMLVAQSVSDDNDPDGYGPAVQMDNVLKLFQTCIQFMLLSKKPSDRLTIDQSLIRSYLFVQYNVSRLNALIDEFDSHHSGDGGGQAADHSLLTSDLEWDLVFKHVQQFAAVEAHVAEDPFHSLSDVISFLLSLSGDVSKFYSKTRVLVKDMEHTMPLIAARISLIRIIRSIFIKCLTMLSVQPVDRM